MTTAAKILRAIEHAAQFAAGGASEEGRARDFISALAGTLDACGPEAQKVAEQVFALHKRLAADPAEGA